MLMRVRHLIIKIAIKHLICLHWKFVLYYINYLYVPTKHGTQAYFE